MTHWRLLSVAFHTVGALRACLPRCVGLILVYAFSFSQAAISSFVGSWARLIVSGGRGHAQRFDLSWSQVCSQLCVSETVCRCWQKL